MIPGFSSEKENMSMLDRYKKTGGFDQLLELVEGFPLLKKEKFLKLIEEENARWAEALRERMLSVDRIFTWPDEVIEKIVKSIPIKNLAVAMRGLKPEQCEKLSTLYSSLELRKIQSTIEVENLLPEEIYSSLLKVIESARSLIKEQKIRPENFDPILISIPESLNGSAEVLTAGEMAKKEKEKADLRAAARLEAKKPAEPPPPEVPLTVLLRSAPPPTGSYVKLRAEFVSLQKAAWDLLNENIKLKNELSDLKVKKNAA